MRITFTLLATALLSACGSPTGMYSAPLPAGFQPYRAPIQAPSLIHSVQAQAVTGISVQEAHDWLADPNAQWLLLDLRTPDEFATGHLTDATLMNFYDTDFRERLLNMNRHQPTIIYCRSGNRSGQALKMMRELGFRNVYDMQGGIEAWKKAGYPLH